MKRLVAFVVLLSACGSCNGSSGSPFDLGGEPRDVVRDADASALDVSVDGSVDGDLTSTDVPSADAPDFDPRCDTIEQELAEWWTENQRCTDDSDCVRFHTNYRDYTYQDCTCQAGVNRTASDEFNIMELRFQLCLLEQIPVCCIEEKGPISCLNGFCY